MKSNKILNILIAAIAIIGGILFIRVLMEDSVAIEESVDLQNRLVSPLISFSLWLCIAAVVITIGLALLSLIRNPENLKKTLAGLLVLAVLLAIAYFWSDSAVIYDAAGKIQPGGEEGSAINRWVGAGIWYSIILGGIASIFFVVDLIKGLIK